MEYASAFRYDLQFPDIRGPTEVDLQRIPEYPASSVLQSIEGQNLKGAAFDQLSLNQAVADQARQRNEAFYQLARDTGIHAAHLQPIVEIAPTCLGQGRVAIPMQ